MFTFISNLGGLFGLFLGFSLVSFLEIVYWFFIKIPRSIYIHVLTYEQIAILPLEALRGPFNCIHPCRKRSRVRIQYISWIIFFGNFSWEFGGIFPKIVKNLPRNSAKLHCKREPYKYQRSFYFYIRMKLLFSYKIIIFLRLINYLWNYLSDFLIKFSIKLVVIQHLLM